MLGAIGEGSVAALFAATLPMAIVQATSTQNDIIVSYWVSHLLFVSHSTGPPAPLHAAASERRWARGVHQADGSCCFLRGSCSFVCAAHARSGAMLGLLDTALTINDRVRTQPALLGSVLGHGTSINPK